MKIGKKHVGVVNEGAENRQYVLFGILFALLALSMCGLTVAFAMFKLPHITVHGWIAMGLGTIFSLIVGCGLMALAFYSARHGYDQAADLNQRRTPDEDGQDKSAP
jgi:hypothetical protein